jgi:hypothetical protein
MPSQFGTDYSRFMNPVPGEESWIPFANPLNDGQRVQNARARASRAGTDIGSGYLNPKSGELQDPDRGFGRAVLSHPEIMIPLVIGSGFGIGALAGPAAAPSAAGALPELSVSTSPIGNIALPTASAAAGPSGGSMGVLGQIGSWIDRGSNVLGNIGRVTSGAAQGSANQRTSDADMLLRQGLLDQQRSNDAYTNQLKSAQFDREEQDRQRKAAILAALLQGTQDQSITPGNPAIAGRMPTVTGGARPSNLTGGGRAEALVNMLGQAGPSAPTYQPPADLNLPNAGLLEKLLGGVGVGSSILGALGKARQ